jgi:hypothetical protein
MKNQYEIKVLKVRLGHWLANQNEGTRKLLELPEMKIMVDFFDNNDVYQIVYAEKATEDNDIIYMQILLTDFKRVIDFIPLVSSPEVFDWEHVNADYPEFINNMISEGILEKRQLYAVSKEEYSNYREFLRKQNIILKDL